MMSLNMVYDYSGLPEGLQGGMERYVEDGIRPGGFLTACLENDLLGAVNRADATNLPRLQDIVRWLYNEAPSSCWGSKVRVDTWHGQAPQAALHECERFLSVCCGATAVEETDCCGQCHDHTSFECGECGAEYAS